MSCSFPGKHPTSSASLPAAAPLSQTLFLSVFECFWAGLERAVRPSDGPAAKAAWWQTTTHTRDGLPSITVDNTATEVGVFTWGTTALSQTHTQDIHTRQPLNTQSGNSKLILVSLVV